MDLNTLLALITAVTSLGSLGSLAFLLKVRADNQKTIAEAEKIQQEAADLSFARLLKLYEVTAHALEECQEDLILAEQGNSGETRTE